MAKARLPKCKYCGSKEVAEVENIYGQGVRCRECMNFTPFASRKRRYPPHGVAYY